MTIMDSGQVELVAIDSSRTMIACGRHYPGDRTSDNTWRAKAEKASRYHQIEERDARSPALYLKFSTRELHGPLAAGPGASSDKSSTQHISKWCLATSFWVVLLYSSKRTLKF